MNTATFLRCKSLYFSNRLVISLLENKETAQNISFGGASNASQTVTVDQILEDNENIKRLVLEIDGEYEKGFYVGDRQNVYSKDGKKYLELDFDLNDDPPATKKDMEKNLKATSLYPSNDEYFINLAQGIIGDVEDPWDKVQLLLNYVDIFIKDDYTTNPHSVYDIIESKVGDCTEHALLFNTLARAAGIPSRELSGIINYENNKFALHAWNEVVIDGYWYPVDPTWNYIVPPLTHIKFNLLDSKSSFSAAKLSKSPKVDCCLSSSSFFITLFAEAADFFRSASSSCLKIAE